MGDPENKATAVDVEPEVEKVTESKEPAGATETKEDKTNETDPTESRDKGENGEKNGSAEDTPGILKTTGKVDYVDYSKNVKFNPHALPPSDDPAEIRQQAEYYFKDFNFPRDKFMWERTGGSENKPIPLDTLLTFGRMHRFKNRDAIVEALRDSTQLEIEGDEGKETLKRKVPYQTATSERREKSEAASIYAKGFGDEVATTQFELEAYFTQFGPVNGVKLRRTNERFFKGSVFVEFEDVETAEAFVKANPKWKGHDLKVMSKKDYCKEKDELISAGKLAPSATQKTFFEGRESGGGRGRGRGRGGRDRDVDKDDWKKRRENDQKNGFRDGRDGRGRGGRGRGRGGRGRDGFGRDRRDRDRDEPRGHNSNDVGKPRIQNSEAKGPPKDKAAEALAKESATNGKRGRDEDGAESGEPVAKKVDTKTEVAAES